MFLKFLKQLGFVFILFLAFGCGSNSGNDDPTPDPEEPVEPTPETPVTPDVDNPDQPSTPALNINDPIDQIARGAFHLCELLNSQVFCWGDNSYNQLQVVTREDYAAITAGLNHTCGLTRTGEIYCWGDPSGQKTLAPRDSGAFVSISAGDNHTCGLTQMGEVHCWGEGSTSWLTIPDQIRTNPAIIKALSSKGNQSCVLVQNGDVLCWGGRFRDYTESNLTQFALGARHGCGITTEGGINCWENNLRGQANSQPASTTGRFVSLSLGELHSCALKDTGEVSCWGSNDFGQLNVPEGNYIQLSTKNNITCGLTNDRQTKCWGERRYIQVSVGDSQNCAIDTHGKVSCWGYNNAGQLDIPADFRDRRFFQVKSGASYACGLLLESWINDQPAGQALCWGRDSQNQVSIPEEIRGQSFTELALGTSHVCGILAENQQVKCWGDADGSGASQVPTDYATVGFSQIAVGNHHSCGILAISNRVFCWGDVDDGRTTIPEGYQLRRFSQISASFNHTCGVLIGDQIDDDGHVICWRGSREYNWGSGATNYDLTVPENFRRKAFKNIDVGNNQACGLLREAALVSDEMGTREVHSICWGDRFFTQPGFPIAFQETVFSQIAAGFRRHSCGLIKNSKQMVCWGTDKLNLVYDANETMNRLARLRFKDIEIGSNNICGIVDRGDSDEVGGPLICWGQDYYDQVAGVDTFAGQLFKKVTVGKDHICGILSVDNSLNCWGRNEYNKVGIGNPVPSLEVGVLEEYADVEFNDVSAGIYHTCASFSDLDTRTTLDVHYSTDRDRDLDTTGRRTLCFGVATRGTINVDPDYSFSSIASGLYHSCGILKDADSDTGKVRCWGGGAGSGNLAVPEEHQNSVFHQISTSLSHVCGILEDNRFPVCWGHNDSRIQIPEAYQRKTFSQITTGYNFTCGLLEYNPDYRSDTEPEDQGKIVCWGDNHFGQLISGTAYENRRFKKISNSSKHWSFCGLLAESEIEEDESNLVCWGMGNGVLIQQFPR